MDFLEFARAAGAGRLATRAKPSLFALCLLASSTAWADFKNDYQDGVEAAGRGDWAEARRLMSAALLVEPTPKSRMRTYGTNFIPYLPHYYLGLASAHLGDCAAAVAAFKTPSHQAIIARQPVPATEQRRQLAHCEQVLLADSQRSELPIAQETPPTAQPSTAVAISAPATDRRATHTVVAGDTLSTIAESIYGSATKYMLIFEANQPMLKDPDQIYPGQVLLIPAE